jgi:hypothetical protein
MGRHAFALAALSAAALACGSSPGNGSLTGGDGGGAGPDASAGDDRRGNPGDDGGTALPDGGDGGVVLPGGRQFPDTFASIAILSDQLPTMSQAQMVFATSHFVGTQKQVLPTTQALRALNNDFLVLHYHLAMWQSAPATQFIVDGQHWGNDYPAVTTNETWFWHNTSGSRVASSADGKLLMNVSVAGFQQYWEQSLEAQVMDGDYDAVFFDSASPALLQGECGGGGAMQDPRLAGTAAGSTAFAELGGATWIDAWQTWIHKLNDDLAAKGIPLIPNTSAFTTTWDRANYGLTAGIFAEGFAGTGFAQADWQASANELLKLAAADKIMLLQNYLSAPTDVATRMYYLGNYLLVKGHHTYLDYFDSGGPLEWYPEWKIDLGAPTTAPTTDVLTLLSNGVYRRDFAKGSVLVNPTSSTVTVPLGGAYSHVVATGGGAVDATGAEPGSLSMQQVTSVDVGPTTAEVVLK